MNEHCFGDAAQWPKRSLVRAIAPESTASRMASELICTYSYVYLKEKQEETLQERGIDTNYIYLKDAAIAADARNISTSGIVGYLNQKHKKAACTTGVTEPWRHITHH
jgi:hypothetical protein